MIRRRRDVFAVVDLFQNLAVLGEVLAQGGVAGVGMTGLPLPVGSSPEQSPVPFVLLGTRRRMQHEQQMPVDRHRALPTHSIAQTPAEGVGNFPVEWNLKSRSGVVGRLAQ